MTRARSGGRRPSPVEHEVTIERLGAGGDGIALLDDKRVFVPLTLPGERWLVTIERSTGDGEHAKPLRQLASVDRNTPICPHFGACGGCTLQHLPDGLYGELKLARLRGALDHARLEYPELAPLQRSSLGSRRRIRLAFARSRSGRVTLGYRQRSARSIVAIDTCPIALPSLQQLLQPLRELLGDRRLHVEEHGGEVSASATPTGIDLVLQDVSAPGLEARELLAEFAVARDLARLSLCRSGSDAPEPVVRHRLPTLQLGSFTVELPPLGFMQATLEGERALQAAVAGWSDSATRILDLYAGLGTLSLPLTARATRLHLVEADEAMVAAARRGLAGQPARSWTVERRDLDRRPLDPFELAPFDLVLLDPPRQGARTQAAAIAASTIGRCIYVSCDPATFARDARLLVDRGFRLEAIRPVDQFLYSPHLELAALLTR